jgi:hypothetical protein
MVTTSVSPPFSTSEPLLGTQITGWPDPPGCAQLPAVGVPFTVAVHEGEPVMTKEVSPLLAATASRTEVIVTGPLPVLLTAMAH